MCDVVSTHFVETHLASVGFWKSLTGDDLEEKHQFQSIAEIIIDVLDCCSSFAQMAVAPGGEGLIWGKKTQQFGCK